MDPLLDGMPCGFLRFDDDLGIHLINRTLADWLRNTPGTLIGDSLEHHLTPASRTFFQTHIFNQLKLQGRVEEIYLTLQASDGEELPVLLNAVRRQVSGETMSDCALMRMCRRQQFEGEILRARKIAEQAMRSLRESNQALRETQDALQEREKQLLVMNQELSIKATRDGLSGVLNRAYFDKSLILQCERACHHQRDLGVLLVDIDHFKRVNDNYGHLVGDQVIQRVAAILQSSVRTEDEVARYGGEEFVILMPGGAREGCVQVAERIRKAVAAPQDAVPPVTVSIGVANRLPGPVDDSAALLASADAALYRAKRSGRNQVVHAGEQPL